VEEQQAYQQSLNRVVREFAEEGDIIIVGRAGQVILRDRPDVLHVRVVASDEVRIERLVEEHHIPVQAAKAQIQASDRSRRNFLKRTYQVNWDDARLYDLVLNTNRLTPESAAKIICKALAELLKQTHSSSNIDVCID
jgi:cytidylate kinase